MPSARHLHVCGAPKEPPRATATCSSGGAQLSSGAQLSKSRRSRPLRPLWPCGAAAGRVVVLGEVGEGSFERGDGVRFARHEAEVPAAAGTTKSRAEDARPQRLDDARDERRLGADGERLLVRPVATARFWTGDMAQPSGPPLAPSGRPRPRGERARRPRCLARIGLLAGAAGAGRPRGADPRPRLSETAPLKVPCSAAHVRHGPRRGALTRRGTRRRRRRRLRTCPLARGRWEVASTRCP